MIPMFYPLRRSQPAAATKFAWMAATAVLLAAMLPSLGMVLREATSGRIMVEICSAHGSRFIELARTDTPEAPARDDGTIHCPLCVTHAGGHALPSQPAAVLVIVSAETPLIQRQVLALPVPEFTTPDSRAPPIRLI